jgi:CBS domain-containing protein
MLRERAWDVMRPDVLALREDMSLGEAATALRRALRLGPDQGCAVILSKDGEYLGVLTAWGLLMHLEECALEDSLLTSAGSDFEDTFRQLCRKCFSRPVGEVARLDAPVVKPAEPLFLVLRALLGAKQRFAVVKEGDKVLGVIAAEDLFRELELDLEG